MSKARGYVQPITRKQALSYERLIPNGIGVTTLAAVNGRGAAARTARANASRGSYARRYAATQAVLRGYAPTMVPVYGIDDAGATTTKKAVANARKATKTKAKKPGSRTMAAKKKAAKKGKKGSSKRKLTKAERKKIALRNLAKARAARKTAGKAKSKRTTKRRSAAKRPAARAPAKRAKRRFDSWKTLRVKGHGKRAKSHAVPLLRARVGRKAFKTYMIPGKGGRVRHVPTWMLVGASSASEWNNISKKAQAGDPKAIKKYNAMKKRVEGVLKQRERAAKRVELHGDMFTPNSTMTYEEWSESMKPNKKRGKKKAAKKTAKKGKTSHAKRVAAAKKAARTRKRNAAAKAATKKTRKTAKKRPSSKRSAAAKKAARTRKRNAAKRPTKKHTKRHAKSSKLVVVVTSRGKKRTYRANKRRGYRRNGFASILPTLKTGVTIGAGLLVHRILRRVLDDNVTGKIEALNSGSVAGYRGLISSAVTALIGVGVVEFVKGKSSTKSTQDALTAVQGGMVASVIFDLLGSILKDQPKALPYFSGVGEYVPMSGFGSYYQMRGVNGLGALTQAAAGFGAPQLTQAAAGMGALTQAAAGMGEFFVPGARGMGEYVETPFNKRLGIGALDEGIAPNIGAAERALTIAEAAAGLGDDGWGDQWGDQATDFQSIVDPTQYAQSISQPDAGIEGGGGVLSPFVNANLIDNVDPNDDGYGLRSGVLQGTGGIFG